LFHKKTKHQHPSKLFFGPAHLNGGSLLFRQPSILLNAMSSSVRSVLHAGSGGLVIDIECHLSNGLPGIVIVGLGNKAIEESKERIRSAFASSKLDLPRKRIIINLAPADIPKESAGLDVPIAAAILVASGQTKHLTTGSEAMVGELGLDGSIRPVRGIIGKLIAGQKLGISTFYIPAANLQQASLVPNIALVPLESLADLHRLANSPTPILPQKTGQGSFTNQRNLQIHASTHVMSDVVGQNQAKRALEVAAAGGHNIFLTGPPGVGKSMLAKALPHIMPMLNTTEILDITHVHSLTTRHYDHLVVQRPFRAPHHSASHIALIGGGATLKPGEISLSHRGVLFLDEFPEFSRQTIEALRQPLEDRTIVVSRAKDSAQYPADFILVATANPCPCGFYGTDKSCTCTAQDIARYKQKISRPILDRIDLYVHMENVAHDRLLQSGTGESDETIRTRVTAARAIQAKRYHSSTKLNNAMDNQEIKGLAHLSTEAQTILNRAAASLDLSARGYMRAIKVARTIADLSRAECIESTHITEAIQFRNQSIVQ
jgi:magnesium chelatase family protein